ncbi:hypothetical protein ACV3XI_06310 [Clostridium perfringens]|uniref:hypothetical protein n=1 Tax=Clostridium perfringens TaxID=1502 RepID=UPI0018E4C235|nr:hypothetical protein [Clostridium perfringens]MBI5994947.1 hypothetical protein [Clostridium perfringens]MDK0691328.1 hypothetical protein [Clostridium perfringens]MDM0988642.1 hypothetical protein [Clostridium perfringens]MDM0991825.1 hypothetical protein [Clostridium perfringens]MDM0994013.1 hypothetical protein [Clostridium perfringens]
MRDKKFLRRIIEILFILLLIVPSQPIYARAGGGGGGGGAGGGGFISSSESGGGKDGASAFDFKFIMKHKLLFGSVAFFLLSGGVVLMFVEMDRYSKVVKRKSDKLKELALKDPYWNINYIKSVVENTFYSIQYAWNDDEYERVESLLTTSLYNKHLKVLEELKSENKKNVLEDIQFNGCRIISLFEGNEEQWGFIWVEVNFSMRDYIVNTKGKRRIIEGNDNYSRSDFEYWKFVYIENTWFLSNILQKNEVGSGYKKLYREAESAYGSSNMKKV